MKYLLAMVLSVILLSNLCLAEEKPNLKNEKAKVNYSVGYQIGADFKHQGVEINPEMLLKGIQDALSGEKALMTPQERRNALVNLQRQVAAQQEQDKPKQAQEYRGEGREFLVENGKKEGVKTTDSGLQYKVIREGTGRSPGATDTVTVHYRGTLIDGNEFDSSYRNGKPASFRVDRVIPGWTEALQLMREGAKWQLFIPPDLAYGERGTLADKTLIFDVELISVQPSK
jgi:FKBP-type peptidyl-prolyl cis-trans isomerase FklB